MDDYLIISATISLSTLLALTLLRDTPPRLRAWLCLIGMTAWCVPWPVLMSLFQQPSVVLLQTVTGLDPAQIPGTHEPSLPASLDWTMAFFALSAFGLGLFLVRCWRHAIYLNRLQGRAQPVPDIWETAGLGNVDIPVFSVAGYDNAFVDGYFRPRIWIGQSKLNDATCATVLQHELEHIQAHDNLRLLYVALLRDVFWWNPIVRALTKRARELIELSCDQRCVATNAAYPQDLARNLLEAGNTDSIGLLTPISGERNFNIFRLSQLHNEFVLKKRHLAPIGALVILGLGACAIQAVTSQDGEVVNHLHIKTTVGPNTNEIETEFIGEPEVAKLLSLADRTTAEVEVKLDGQRRSISIQSSSQEETRRLLTAFDGTPMQAVLAPSNTGPDMTGVPILIDLQVEINDESVFDAKLLANDSDWTGIGTGDHLLRIKPTLMPGPTNNDPRIVRIDAEIVQREGDNYEVIARPRFATPLGEQGLITSRTDAYDIKLALTASAVN